MLLNIKKNYLILIFTILFLYFFFNILDGERGLISYFEKKNKLEELKNKKIILSNKVNDLENEKVKIINNIDELEIKNSLLTDNLDLDYIEILIRQKFLFGKSDEKNLFI